MSDVEFLEPDGAPDDTPDAGGEPPAGTAASRVTRRVPPELIALVASVAGVVLAVLGAFAAAYRVRVTGIAASEGGGGYRLDGWGRYDESSGSVGQHGPRLGIALCVAAGLVLVGVVLWLLSRWRMSRRHGRRLQSIGTGLVLLASGAVLATEGSALLSALASADSYRAALRATDFTTPDGTQPTPQVRLEIGGLLWFEIAATVLLWIAVLAAASVRTPATAARPAVDSPAAESHAAETLPAEPPPLHRDDELLGG